MGKISLLLIVSISILVLGLFVTGQDALAYKGTGVDSQKYGQKTSGIVCGDEICTEKLSMQEKIDRYLWETRAGPKAASIVNEIEELQNKINKLTLELQEITGEESSLQQQAFLSASVFDSTDMGLIDPSQPTLKSGDDDQVPDPADECYLECMDSENDIDRCSDHCYGSTSGPDEDTPPIEGEDYVDLGGVNFAGDSQSTSIQLSSQQRLNLMDNIAAIQTALDLGNYNQLQIELVNFSELNYKIRLNNNGNYLEGTRSFVGDIEILDCSSGCTWNELDAFANDCADRGGTEDDNFEDPGGPAGTGDDDPPEEGDLGDDDTAYSSGQATCMP